MSRDSTLTVSLTKQLRQYVRDKVEKGGYESASEVIREGLRVLQHEEKQRKLYRAELRKKIAEGRDAIARGDVMDVDVFMQQQLTKLKGRSRRRAG